MGVISINDLHKSFKKKEVLKGISLEVNEGEVLGLIGPNGAGKTTLLKNICGLLSFDSGSISVNGQSVAEKGNSICTNIGVLIEETCAYPKLTGFKNLRLIADLYDSNITDEEINNIVDIVDLKDNIHKKFKTYSLGMKQRLGIAMALLNSPKILILDEPINGLDVAGAKNIRELIRFLAERRNITVLISSHMLSELDKTCDRAAFIKDGKIIKVATKDELDSEGFEEEYFKLMGSEEKNYEIL